MKVLLVSAWFPYPPDNGSRIRVYNLIRALSRRHKVYLVSLLQDDSVRENARHLGDICEVVSLHESAWFSPKGIKAIVGFFSSRPRSAVCTYDWRIRKAVEDAVDSIAPDVVIASTLGVVEYIPCKTGLPAVLEQHNCEYAVLRRAANRMSGLLKRARYAAGWKKFAKWEAMICRCYDCVVMVSDEDRRMMLQAAPDLADVRVVPNGVDVERYTPESYDPDVGILLYNGALTYGANLDAVRYYASEVYPILEREIPGVRLLVTGRTTGVDLRGVGDCPGIELVGYVDDIRDVLRRAGACVVPLREGGGSRLKILEAMAAGVPVVSTSMGAEGIDALHGEHLLIADTPDEFAHAIVQVLQDQSLRTRLASAARSLVERRYSWHSIGAQFVDVVESVADRRSLPGKGPVA